MKTIEVHVCAFLTLSSLAIGRVLSFATFNFFIVGLGRNGVYGAFYSAQMAHKSVRTSSAKEAEPLRAFCSTINKVANMKNGRLALQLR